MSKKEMLQNGIKQVFYEEAWYPPISDALKDLTAAQACWQQYMNILLHDAYHTGQIVQLRKLQGSWPAHRSYL
ncbi:TPA: hypothetical protein QC116_006303 [Bacillus thuringiensis]|nr:hypothetical protein [Bacillus thuringiensis]HDR8186735.1 hypothetical protein [Bacillus thuringiensis]